MDTAEDARAYDAMDHRAVNEAFVDRVLEVWGVRHDPRVLDMGCGTAQIPIVLARRRPDARIVATDLARHMLDVGAENLRVAGVAGRVELRLADCKALDFPDGAFDLAISNSLVHHLPEPTPALREAARVVRPGGAIVFRDLLRPESRDEVARIVATYAAGADAVQRDLFRASLCAALTLDELRDVAAAAGLAAAHVYRSSDRHFTLEVASA